MPLRHPILCAFTDHFLDHFNSFFFFLHSVPQYGTSQQRVRVDIHKLVTRFPSLKPKEDTFGNIPPRLIIQESFSDPRELFPSK